MSACPKYETCRAPICPAEDISSENPNWFPGEPICAYRAYATNEVVVKQRKIKEAGLRRSAGYFTRPMLVVLGRIDKRLKGADPDDGEEGEKRWIRERRRKKD